MVGSEILTVVVIKSCVFWNITQCSPLKTNRRLGEIYRLYLLGRISQARNQQILPTTFTLVSSLAYSSIRKMWICSPETSVDF
jgi:hypothetical protein